MSDFLHSAVLPYLHLWRCYMHLWAVLPASLTMLPASQISGATCISDVIIWRTTTFAMLGAPRFGRIADWASPVVKPILTHLSSAELNNTFMTQTTFLMKNADKSFSWGFKLNCGWVKTPNPTSIGWMSRRLLPNYYESRQYRVYQ